MTPEENWNQLSRRVFPSAQQKASPYLWTRVLAGIEAQEERRSPWWVQWRWMSRVTVAATLLISVGTYYFFSQSVLPLDSALEGRSSQQQALQIASSDTQTLDAEVALLPGEDS